MSMKSDCVATIRKLATYIVQQLCIVGPRLSESPLSEPSVIRTLFRILKSQKRV